jgi:succinyl-CoA synthetase alpha subunit
VGIVSRSGTLTYQALYELQAPGHRRHHLRRYRWRPSSRHSFIDCLEAFEADPDTKAVMMIGEIGGSAEEEAAEFIKTKMTKPVSAYIAGVTAPPGKKMGHAGAIVSGGKGTAAGQDGGPGRRREGGGNNPTEAGELMVEIVKSL